MDKKKMLNTYYNYPLADGSTVKMTMNFFYLLQLKNKDKSLYERYNKVFAKQSSKNAEYDELDNMLILYTAYCCANLSDENLMSEEDFLMMCGSDRKAMGEALKALLAPKN